MESGFAVTGSAVGIRSTFQPSPETLQLFWPNSCGGEKSTMVHNVTANAVRWRIDMAGREYDVRETRMSYQYRRPSRRATVPRLDHRQAGAYDASRETGGRSGGKQNEVSTRKKYTKHDNL